MQFWKYLAEHSGKKKAINYCDGSPLKIKGICNSNKYTAFVPQHGIFFRNEFELLYNGIR